MCMFSVRRFQYRSKPGVMFAFITDTNEYHGKLILLLNMSLYCEHLTNVLTLKVLIAL